jgi:MoaA/NifB/PqqE/SkfB family radical SAM enzyme
MCLFNGPDAARRDKQSLSASQVRKFIHGLPPLQGKDVWFFGTGEFLLDQHALEYVLFTKENGHIPCILTNGQLLMHEMIDKFLDAGVRKFSISTDKIKPDEYAEIRIGGDFNKILDAFEYLKFKKTEYPDIVAETRNVLLSPYRQETIDENCEFWNGKVDFLTFF